MYFYRHAGPTDLKRYPLRKKMLAAQEIILQIVDILEILLLLQNK